MQSIEVFKSGLALSGLSGALDGVVGSTLSSFQHHVRLRPIANLGTGRITNVFGFYASPSATVDTGWSVNNDSPLRIEAPGGSGAILNLTGLEIRVSGPRNVQLLDAFLRPGGAHAPFGGCQHRLAGHPRIDAAPARQPQFTTAH